MANTSAAVGMAVLMGITPVISAVPAYADSSDEQVDKEESVYVNADASGKTSKITVSDHLRNPDGASTLEDSSTLSDIENVKGDEEKGTKVRIIGVDTPESVAPAEYRKDNTEEGKTVSDVVKNKLKEGSTVLVEFDAQREDKYGRTLAYVYMSDGKMVEDWLLESGLANVATYPPNVKYADHFQELAHEAWENKVGLWADFFKEEPTEKTK